MRAMELSDPGPAAGGRARLAAVERADPVPGWGEVLVEVVACAVCRTVLQIVSGDLPARRLPIVPGHQVVGRIAARGDGVDPDAHPLGCRVGVACKPAFPSADAEQTAVVLNMLVESGGMLNAADIAARFKQGQKVRPAVASVLLSLYRIGLISTSDGGKTFAWRRAA